MKATIDKKHIFDCTESEIDDLSLGKLSLPYGQEGFFDFDRVWNSSKKEIKTLFYEYKKKTKQEIYNAYNLWALNLYKKATVSIFQDQYRTTNSSLEQSVFIKEIQLIRECNSAFMISQKIKSFPHYKNIIIANAIRQQEETFQLQMRYILHNREAKVLPEIPGFRFITVMDEMMTHGHHVNSNDIPSIRRQSKIPYVISSFSSYSPIYSCYLSREETIFLLVVACSYTYPAYFTKYNGISDLAWKHNKKWIYDNDPNPCQERLQITKYNGIQASVFQEKLLDFPIEWNEYCDSIYREYFDSNRKSKDMSPMKKEFEDFLNS